MVEEGVCFLEFRFFAFHFHFCRFQRSIEPVGFVGEVLLARLLSPQDFGVYAVASFVTVTLSGVLEVGLAASLIQRPEEPLDEEYQVLFTFQFLTITAFVLLTFLASPLIFPLLNLQVAARWTLLALLLCPWISSLGTMSCVKLERYLRKWANAFLLSPAKRFRALRHSLKC